MSSIIKRDRDLGLASAYRDLENPGRIKAKQSSNVVFLSSALIIGVVAMIYAKLMTENMNLKRQIKTHQDYMEDQNNINTFDWHTLLQQRSAELVNYRDGAEKFLEQLKTTHRYSEEDFRFFENALKEATVNTAEIVRFSGDFNIVTLRCIVPDETMPKMFAEYMTNMKDEEGNSKYAAVVYNGFNLEKNDYSFELVIYMWDKPN